MRKLLVIACLALPGGTASGTEHWESLLPELGTGSATCADDENIVCAALMCEGRTLTLGVLGTGHGGIEPPVDVVLDVDGVTETRRMTSRIVAAEFLHIRAPVARAEPLVARMLSGRRLRITTFDPEEPHDYSLRGFPAEFDRVEATCR